MKVEPVRERKPSAFRLGHRDPWHLRIGPPITTCSAEALILASLLGADVLDSSDEAMRTATARIISYI